MFVDAIFDNPDQYSGLALFGVLFTPFSCMQIFGGMDVVIGIASMFGIELDENFKRDYDYNPEGEFSTGISQFIRYENVDEKRLEETGQIYQSRLIFKTKVNTVS